MNITAGIKNATALLHQNLENSTLSKKLLAPGACKEDYVAYLKAVYELHQPVETHIFPLLTTIVSDIGERHKSAAIAADLQSLQDAATVVDNINLPMHSIGFALGMVYVTEGSTLGGIYIMKRLSENLGNTFPYSFLNVYGNEAGKRWQAFLNVINQYAANADEQEQQEIIAGAVYAFERANYIFKTSD